LPKIRAPPPKIPARSRHRGSALDLGSGHAPPAAGTPRGSTERLDKKTLASLRHAVVDLYRRMRLLQNFATVNYTAVIKIVKKHDKNFSDPRSKLKHRVKTLIEGRHFGTYASGRLADMVSTVEQHYAARFTDGNVQVARATLLAKQSTDYNWASFRIGMRVGTCMALVVWLLWDFVVDESRGYNIYEDRAALNVYKAVGPFCLVPWIMAVLVHVWKLYRVNYLYIFELNQTLDSAKLVETASAVTIVYLFNLLLFYKVRRGVFTDVVPAGYYPASLFVGFLVYAMLRLPKQLWSTLRNVLLSPWYGVRFRDAFLGDVLTSLAKPLVDAGATACYALHGWHVCDETSGFRAYINPLISAAPLMLRFVQNLVRYRDTGRRMPHLPNALKYAVAHTVVIFSAYHREELTPRSRNDFDATQVAFLACFVFATLYQYVWDVRMDWMLGRWGDGSGSRGLRARLMYAPVVYWVAVVADFFLRFIWTLTLVPSDAESLPIAFRSITLHLKPLLGAIEILRRGMWSLIRVESQHLSNYERFRRIDFIPLHFSTPKESKKEAGRSVWIEIAVFFMIVICVAVLAAEEGT
jgi:hypothetical protein